LSKPIEVDKLEEKLAKYLPKEKISYRSEEKAKEKKPENFQKKEEIFEFLPETEASEGIMEFSPADSVEAEENIMEFSPADFVEEEEKEKSSFEDVLEKVEAVGIRTEEGMQYCAGERDFYIEMLKDYVLAHGKREEELVKYYEEKSWKEYETVIHALKSTSKTIGAQELFEKARALEEAAGEEDTGFLEQNHGAFLEKYHEMTEKIKGVL
ncbi:MAG: hypothetical protein IJ733_17625, partial [Lachnospiraceae bacterium]|nr:hypothetical protein [Lachnospiraceae bacterium]